MASLSTSPPEQSHSPTTQTIQLKPSTNAPYAGVLIFQPTTRTTPPRHNYRSRRLLRARCLVFSQRHPQLERRRQQRKHSVHVARGKDAQHQHHRQFRQQLRLAAEWLTHSLHHPDPVTLFRSQTPLYETHRPLLYGHAVAVPIIRSCRGGACPARRLHVCAASAPQPQTAASNGGDFYQPTRIAAGKFC